MNSDFQNAFGRSYSQFGESTSFYKKKDYLAFDSSQKKWRVIKLNSLQRVLRALHFAYNNTQFTRVYADLRVHPGLLPKKLQTKIEILWRQRHPLGKHFEKVLKVFDETKEKEKTSLLSSKRYVYLDHKKCEWKVARLNVFQRALRRIGIAYRYTHLSRLIVDLPEDEAGKRVQKSIKTLWRKAHPKKKLPFLLSLTATSFPAAKKKWTQIKVPKVDPAHPIFAPCSKKVEKASLFEGLPTKAKDVDFSSKENASLAFALLNTDFTGMDLSDYSTTSTKALALMIQSLENQQEKRSKPSKEKLNKLLRKFQCAYEFAVWNKALHHRCKTRVEFAKARSHFEQEVSRRLQKGESLYLSSGWDGEPSGHNITLELVPEVGEKGNLFVTGRIQNRGAGIEDHPAFIKGTKITYDPELVLSKIALSELIDSQFLSNYLQLHFVRRPYDKGVSEVEDTVRPTVFSQKDFYDVFLPSWPGSVQPSKKPHPRTAQRGPTCTIKPLITEMKNLLGEEEGAVVKFYITKATWENFIENVGVNETNVHQIAPLLAKLARRALKLQRQGEITQGELEEVNRFCVEVQGKIDAVRTEVARNTCLAKSAIQTQVKERTSYSLEVPSPPPLPKIGKTETIKESSLQLDGFAGDDVESFIYDEFSRILKYNKYYKASAPRNEQSMWWSLEGKDVKEVQNSIFNCLQALPPPLDVAWTKVKNRAQLLKDLRDMQRILTETLPKGPLAMTPARTCVIVKTLGIIYRLAEEELPKDLCQFYARGIKNLIDARLPALFCPLHPRNLEGFRDTVQLINRDLKDAPFGKSLIGETVHTKSEAHGSTEYFKKEISGLKDVFEDPELSFLHGFSKKYGYVKKATGSIDDASGVIYAYNLKDSNKGTEPGNVIPQEYQALRLSFFCTCLFLDFRGKKDTRGTEIYFTTRDSKEERSVSMRFMSLEQLDESNYNRGVFADAFSSIGSSQASESFVTGLLGKRPKKGKGTFTTQNTLSLLQRDELVSLGRGKGSLSLSPMDLQDLFATRLPDALPLPQIEGYFEGNLSKLEQPFFQSLFLTLLTKVQGRSLQSPIHEAIQRSPPSKEIDNFFSFLQKSLVRARSTRSWGIYFFLLRIYAIALSHSLQYDPNSTRTENLVCLFEKELKQISSENWLKKISPIGRSMFHNSLMAIVPYLSCQNRTIPIVRRFQRVIDTLPITVVDPSAAEDFHLREDLQEGIFQLKNLKHLAEPRSRSKSVSTLLPHWMTQHELYAELFTINYPAKKLSAGYYEFIDERGIQYRLYGNKEGSLRIFRSFEEGGKKTWYAFDKDGPFKRSISDKQHPCYERGGCLQKGSVFWCEVGTQEVRVLDKQRDTLLCRVTPKEIGHPKSRQLVLAKNYATPVVEELARLSSKRQILAWKDKTSGIFTAIDLKEFGVRFSKEIDEEGRVRWNSSKHHGYYIDTQQKTPGFEPFPHYLILRNDKGQQKVLVPSRRYFPEKIRFQKRTALKKTFVVSLKELFTYDLTSEGTIVPPEEPYALQYLLYLALKKQDYALGFQVLEKWALHPSEWNASMVEMMFYFETIISHGIGDVSDKHSKAVALRLKLKAMMLAHSSEELDPRQKNFLKIDYIRYLNQINNIQGSQRLAPEEEACFYEVFSSRSVSVVERALLSNRKEQLETAGAIFPKSQKLIVHGEMPEWTFQLSDRWNWIDEAMQKKMIASLEKPTPIAFSMRPSVSFLHNFLYYYTILQTNRSGYQIQQIKELLNACRYAKDPYIKGVRDLLVAVLADPEGFPPCEALLNPEGKENIDTGETRLQITLSKLAAKKKSVAELPSFRLDKKEVGRRPAKPALEPPLARDVKQVKAEFADVLDGLVKTFTEHGWVARSAKDVEKKKDPKSLKELEEFYSKESKADSPPVAREFQRLLAGVEAVIQEGSDSISEITFSNIPNAITHLKEQRKQDLLTLQGEEQEIHEFLHTYPVLRSVERHGELLRPLSFEEALIFFGRGEDAPFYRANPDLTREELLILKKKMGEYLIHKLNWQKCVRLIEDLEKAHMVGKEKGIDSPEYLVAKDRAYATLEAVRAYEPQKKPHLLVFEAFANICLRKEQLDALGKLKGGKESANTIFEARTGFGKSKALIPLWLYLTAKQRKGEAIPGIAMMTVPASLYQQQVVYLKKVLGGAFHQSVFAFQFNRGKGGNLRYLKNLRKTLEKAALSGMCVLTTTNSLHGLINLKLKECLASEQTEENRALICELRAIRKIAKNQLSNFFDESRECFDIRRYFDYSIGAPKAIPQGYCTAVQNIYQVVLDLEISVDFLPQGEKHTLTEEGYEKGWKEKIASSLLSRFLKGRKRQPPAETRKLLLQHLMGAYDPKVDSYLDAIPDSERRLYAIYRNQINVYLPRTLTRPCNGRYGLASKATGNRLAYPFQRGVPRLSSQFSTIDDLLDFTTQANLKTPLSEQEISRFITSLKFRLEQAEDQESFKRSDPQYLCYERIANALPDFPFSPSGCGKKEVSQLQAALNDPKNLKLKLAFITGYILPQITIHTQKVSSTAHNLVEAMQTAYGASGTINADTLSPKLKTVEHPQTPIGSILSMWKASKEAVHVVKTQKAKDLLKTLVETREEYSVIIDVASSFRDIRDERKIAKILFAGTARRKPPVDAVSYYDEAGRNLVFLRAKKGEEMRDPIPREQCTVPLENIFVFMRQSATVGADTPMPMTAQALVTLDGNTQRDLFLQGAGRMRGILKGQKVGFVIQKKDVEAFGRDLKGSQVGLPAILSLVSTKQGEQRGRDLFFNLQLLLQNLLEKQLWSFIENEENSDAACIKMFEGLKKIFVQNTLEDPLDSLKQSRGEIFVKEAVEQLKVRFKRKVEKTKGINVEEIFTEFEKLVDYEKLPKTIQVGAAEEHEAEVEAAEVEGEGVEAIELAVEVHAAAVEQEGEQEGEREQVGISALPAVSFTPAEPKDPEEYRTLGQKESQKASCHFPPRFARILKGIYGSTNFFCMNTEGARPRGVLKTAYQYLVIQRGENFQVILMDQKDARAAMDKMIEEEDADVETSFYLMSSTGKVIVQNAEEDFGYDIWKKHPHLTLLTKVFSRQNRFTKEEVDYLRTLDSAQQKLLFDFFDTEIAYCWPSMSADFSSLRKRVEEISADEE